MKHFGLLGRKLAHSLSKQYFDQNIISGKLRDSEYTLYELEGISALPCFLEEHRDLDGFNVTIPYKKIIIPFLDDLTSEAEEIGAVNVVEIHHTEKGDHLIGHNTDAKGFLQSVKGIELPKHALILGTGGAASAIAYALRQLGIVYQYVSRDTRQDVLNYNQLTSEIMQSNLLIINCTPLGMLPDNIESKPDIPYEMLTSDHFLYDLVYNPEESVFLKEGKIRGCHCMNGLQMLHLQAEETYRIWGLL